MWQTRGELWRLGGRPLGQSRQRLPVICMRVTHLNALGWSLHWLNHIWAQVPFQTRARALTSEGCRHGRKEKKKPNRIDHWNEEQPRRLSQFLKSYCVSSGQWRTNYLGKGKLDILQQEEGGGGKHQLWFLERMLKEEGKKKKSRVLYHI